MLGVTPVVGTPMMKMIKFSSSEKFHCIIEKVKD